MNGLQNPDENPPVNYAETMDYKLFQWNEWVTKFAK